MTSPDATRRRSTRDRPAKPPLSQRAVIEAGMRVLRDEGLDAVTMRRVATELDTGAASLYVYVGGRDELLRLLFDEVAGAVELPPLDAPRWREQIRELCLAMLEALQAHPGIARVALAEPPFGPQAMLGAERMMALLLAGGVEPRDAASALDALFLLITANAVEVEVRRERESAGDPPPYDPESVTRLFAALPADRYPTLVEHRAVMAGGDRRQRFSFQIDTFLDGLVR